MESEYVEVEYKVAGIDIHKKMLAVVVAVAGGIGELQFERKKFETGDSALRSLAAWLAERKVEEVVMESTAQYWRPVWLMLEDSFGLQLAQAQSNQGPKGRKTDYRDAERLVRRYLAGELILSFVPDEEQRLWRLMTRSKQQLVRDRVRLQNQLEGFLEDSRIKLSSRVSNLLGVSSRRMLQALADGATDPAQIACLAHGTLHATLAQLADALIGAATLSSPRRHLLKLYLERLEFLDQQIEDLAKTAAEVMRLHQDVVARLCQVPGLGAESAHQIIAEVGPQAARFASGEHLASWVGCCPGREESAEKSESDQSPKGNRQMRRLLNQSANAAIKAKGTIFQDLYRRLVPRIGHPKAVWAVAHKLCRIIWKILHDEVEYRELSRCPDPQTIQRRINRAVRHLRALGCKVAITTPTELAVQR